MKKKILIIMGAICLMLCGCSSDNKNDNADEAKTVDESSSASDEAKTIDEADSKKETKADDPKKQTSEDNNKKESSTDAKFFSDTKNYILNGQDSSKQQLFWSPSFLEVVDMEKVYKSYINDGGKSKDTQAFATYLTEHAAAPSNWKELFEKDLMASYSKKTEKYEDLGNGIYQVYVKIDGTVVPYVVVNSHTGWYHG